MMAAVVMLPDISLQQSDILGLEVGHDTSGHQGVVVRVEQEDYRQEEHKGIVKLEQDICYEFLRSLSRDPTEERTLFVGQPKTSHLYQLLTSFKTVGKDL
jgi:hypothetical protein